MLTGLSEREANEQQSLALHRSHYAISFFVSLIHNHLLSLLRTPPDHATRIWPPEQFSWGPPVGYKLFLRSTTPATCGTGTHNSGHLPLESAPEDRSIATHTITDNSQRGALSRAQFRRSNGPCIISLGGQPRGQRHPRLLDCPDDTRGQLYVKPTAAATDPHRIHSHGNAPVQTSSN